MFIIGICGGSASGKTTLIKRLTAQFSTKDLSIIEQDNYYKPLPQLSIKERATINFDHPNAIDFKLLVKHVKLLQSNKAIKSPNYCFKTHNRKETSTTILPKKIVIVDGILILQDPELSKIMDYKVFVDTPQKTRLQRRITRDKIERNRTEASVIEQFNTYVQPMHEKFVEIHKNNCELIFDGTKQFNEDIEYLKSIINNHL